MSVFQHLKEEAWEANMELSKSGVIIMTFGNASALDRERGVFAIKPSGVPYPDLKPEHMVVVDLQSEIVEGHLNPSSDTKTHAVLYRNLLSVGGVVHTHSTYATAWAQASRPIPIYGTTHADQLAVDIPCTALIADTGLEHYEEETGKQIVETLKGFNPDEVQMMLVAGHGPFTWGQNAAEAVHHAVILEELAKMACLTEQLHPGCPRLKKSIVDKHYFRKHGKQAYYGQNRTDFKK